MGWILIITGSAGVLISIGVMIYALLKKNQSNKPRYMQKGVPKSSRAAHSPHSNHKSVVPLHLELDDRPTEFLEKEKKDLLKNANEDKDTELLLSHPAPRDGANRDVDSETILGSK